MNNPSEFTPKNIAAFWNKVSIKGPSECWEWLNHGSKQGYGMLRYPRTRNTVMAHRISWLLTNGPIPEGFKVLHKCDNPPCVNPNHLFLGTQTDNMQDAMRKGRRRFYTGPKPNAWKISPEIRKMIVEEYLDGEPSMKSLGIKHGVSAQNICDIVKSLPKSVKRKNKGGERTPGAKLTPMKVIEIRRRWHSGESQTELSREFGVYQSAIYKIVNRENWKSVP